MKKMVELVLISPEGYVTQIKEVSDEEWNQPSKNQED
jgi:hypothetical protein